MPRKTGAGDRVVVRESKQQRWSGHDSEHSALERGAWEEGGGGVTPGKKARRLRAVAGRQSTGTAAAHRRSCAKCYKMLVQEEQYRVAREVGGFQHIACKPTVEQESAAMEEVVSGAGQARGGHATHLNPATLLRW